MSGIWHMVIGVAVGLVACWLVLLGALAIARPKGNLLTEAIRLLPDLLCLVSRLARDRTLPRRTRWLLWILLGYLALPIDLVPDFIPVLGYADDAIAVALVLRTVLRQSGTDALDRHWPGTPTDSASYADGQGCPPRLPRSRSPPGSQDSGAVSDVGCPWPVDRPDEVRPGRGRATVRVHTGIGCGSVADVYQDPRTYVWSSDVNTATLRNGSPA
ncbi:YkvA family protein [Streptomyces sp. NPDC007162]|uniref:YkvA family protein n=1 Tax=Streptomyces sp. NPDC007162 TaxID=3156917 RepID=UPI0033CB949F